MKPQAGEKGEEEMKDICYKCGKVQDYGTMQDVSPTEFDIFCDACIEDAKAERTKVLACEASNIGAKRL